MRIVEFDEPTPADAVDLAIGVRRESVACINNRVITTLDAGQVLCPPGWDILFDGVLLMIVYDETSEVENA